MSGEHLLEGLDLIFAMAIITLKSFFFLSHGVDSGLERLVGGVACVWLHIWQDPNGGVLGVVIDE